MISAIVLTHNDAKILRRCLISLAWCDEVVVVDDESTDETVSVAKKQGATVVTHPLHNDFAAQRNFGVSKAKNDWILFVDSDEVVTEDLKKEIKQMLDSRLRGNDNKESGNVGYYIKRKDFFWGKWLAHGETANVRLLRLSKKDNGRWQRPVHEVWSPYAKASGDEYVIGELKESLLHFPHPNVAQFLEEINRYSSLNAQFLYRKNIRVHWWQIAAYPAAKFFLNYFWRLGLLDGTPGAVMAIMMSFHSFLVRAKLWQLRDTKK